MSIYFESEITDPLVLHRIHQLRGVYPNLKFKYGYDSYNLDAGLFYYTFYTGLLRTQGLAEIHITGNGKIMFYTAGEGGIVIVG